MPDAKITELNIDTWKNKTVGEADVVDGCGTKYEVKVDATSGKVVSKRVDRWRWRHPVT